MRQSSTGTASASSQSSLEGDYETNLQIEAAEPPVQVNTLLPKKPSLSFDFFFLKYIFCFAFELCSALIECCDFQPSVQLRASVTRC